MTPISPLENQFHAQVIHDQGDQIVNMLLHTQQFSGHFLGNELIYSVLHHPKCVKWIAASKQFQKIPLETIAKAYLYALRMCDNGTSKELYDTGRIPGNFYELVPNPEREMTMTTLSPGFTPALSLWKDRHPGQR